MSRARFLRRQAERLRHARDKSKVQLTLVEAQAEAKEEQQTKRLANTNLVAIQGIVEQRIQDGIEKGVFDNLPGAGKPLNLYDDAFVPEDMRMGFRLLRSNGLAPLWVEANKEIQDDHTRMQRMCEIARQRWQRVSVREREQLRDDYVRRIKEINDKILRYNLLAPASHVHLGLLIPHEELAAFDALMGPVAH